MGILKCSTILRNSEYFGLENSEVSVLRMTRSEFKKHKNNGKLDLAGVYVIYSTTSVVTGIYIGEGDDVRSRLKQHDSDKKFWDELIIFTSSRMNVAFAKNIEYQFINRAKLSSKYPLYNGVSGGRRKLGNEDREHLKKHLIDFYKVIELTNIDIFELNPSVVYKINKYGHDMNVKILNLDAREIRVLSGSIIGSAFSSKADMGGIDFEILDDGRYQIKNDVDLQLPVGYSALFEVVNINLIKNENNKSLSSVLDSILG